MSDPVAELMTILEARIAEQKERKAREEAEAARRVPRLIARYLTLAGEAMRDAALAVTVTEIDRDERGGGVYTTVAACGGCPDTDRFPWGDYDYGNRWSELTGQQRAEARAREWAQAHAETCRAMSLPEAP
ncbi:hypothetical protein ACH4GK_31935 [Streptomyces rimosus]|uniref:hypothetical protein n=1 Tax=Streptomyces rimosus TaxID=1927 RepID=UPI00131AF1C5|nr:hypothetical protein [Streptomyces rimosus]